MYVHDASDYTPPTIPTMVEHEQDQSGGSHGQLDDQARRASFVALAGSENSEARLLSNST